jgi:hypothetical protein
MKTKIPPPFTAQNATDLYLFNADNLANFALQKPFVSKGKNMTNFIFGQLCRTASTPSSLLQFGSPCFSFFVKKSRSSFVKFINEPSHKREVISHTTKL